MLTVDTTGFEAMCRDLSHMGASPFGPIVLSEAGHALEGAARDTRAKSVEQISESVIRKFNNYSGGKFGEANTRELYPRISNAPTAGRKWWVDRNAAGQRTFYIMNGQRKWSNARWSRYTAEVSAQTHDAQAFFQKARRARGLAKNSWYQAGQSLGLDINVPDYARNAVPSNGHIYINGNSNTVSTADEFYIDLFNHYPPLVDQLGGAGILQRAINGRVKYFETLLAKGFFDNLKLRAERYPQVFVT